MASGTGTASGTTGPAKTTGSLSVPNITLLKVEPVRRVITVEYDNGKSRVELDYALTTTVTDTISGVVSTFAIS